MRISVGHALSMLALLVGCMGEVGPEHELQAQTAPGAADGGAADAASPSTPTAAADACPAGQQRQPATGLRIREVALYQTLKIPLYQNGTWVTNRPVQVIQGRRALARVFVDTLPGYTRKSVRALLTLQNGQSVQTLTNVRELAASSTDPDLQSTFTFDVNGALLDASTQLSVALVEPECRAGAAAAASRDVRVPQSGTQALGAIATGKLRVVIVPISVGGRLPATGAREVADMKAALFAYYPVPEVELTVRAPLNWTRPVAPSNQSNWSTLLNQIMRLRSQDRAAADVYYFGLMQPAANMRTFCGRGCILGIAPQVTRVSPGAQVGLGAAFTDAQNQSLETLVHELGHAHGRGHAPCASGGRIAGVDTRFPNAQGAIGTWGWDNRSNALYPPTHKDVMGYCRPNWISAYTYAALTARSLAVNRRAYMLPPLSGKRWHSIIAYDDGSTRWSGNVELEEPSGEPEAATVRDAEGNAIDEIEVYRMELSHSSDQFVYFPEPGANWASIELAGRTLDLAQVEPAL